MTKLKINRLWLEPTKYSLNMISSLDNPKGYKDDLVVRVGELGIKVIRKTHKLESNQTNKGCAINDASTKR